MTYTAIRLYARFSNLEQKVGMSIERQLGSMYERCREKAYIPDSEIIDEGRSAFHSHNRSMGLLGQYEAEALRGEHDGELLIVERLDRLSRAGHHDTYMLITSLTACGVSIETVDGGAVYRAGEKLDIVQVITMLVKAETAFDESEKKSERSRSNWRIKYERAMRDGTALGRNCPPWLTVIDGRYVVNPQFAALVLRIFTMSDAGDGAGLITQKLNREGVAYWAKPRAAGKKAVAKFWHRPRIIELLANRATLGEAVSPDGEAFMLYPPVVPADLFERVNRDAPNRKAMRGGAKSSKIANLLAGLCRCDECHSTVAYTGQGYLRCTQAVNGACSNTRSVSYNSFEKALLDTCLHLALDDNAFSNKAEVSRLNTTIAQRKREHEQATDRARNLMSVAASKGSDMAAQMATEAEDEAKAILANVEALKAQREAARGRASNQEHLLRVADIRAKIYDPDLTVRIPLRRKVAQALHSLVTMIWFDSEGVATVALAGGIAAFTIRKGKLQNQANALRMFEGCDFTSLHPRNKIDADAIPQVSRRLKATLEARGMLRAG